MKSVATKWKRHCFSPPPFLKQHLIFQQKNLDVEMSKWLKYIEFSYSSVDKRLKKKNSTKYFISSFLGEGGGGVVGRRHE